ncbi:AbrB/MazE/SpoVT family DNA-binding domain-containing protein [Actinocrispum wychmicini]|uniref:AbrB family looped-hinge helix DNA binding protein n=1 Tax=Actinocrispum wychmicini TaxID=1213861 RepID=A0A4R2JUS6_9PSEU|nr:AbrB/MazE/SpoVT family DNA-binding domain-containing protein [Actinocrispum wychmicini]TCO61078.1 AbrB family looped-hinge helix DNA binding protein [Actinocrispum wychmicini]
MTGLVIAPVIPSSTSAARTRSQKSSARRVLPLVTVATPPAAPADVIYGMGRMDASGRIADRTVTHALGWHAGDRLTLTGTPGGVIARRAPDGMVTLTTRPYITIPAALRRRCGLQPGDRVLLAAKLGDNLMTVYPLAVVDQAIREHRRSTDHLGGDRS